MGKRKSAKRNEDTGESLEAITVEEVTDAAEQPTPQETEPQQAQPQQEREAIKNLLATAPELFGWNPTAKEIEHFRGEYTVWLSNLKSLT